MICIMTIAIAFSALTALSACTGYQSVGSMGGMVCNEKVKVFCGRSPIPKGKWTPSNSAKTIAKVHSINIHNDKGAVSLRRLYQFYYEANDQDNFFFRISFTACGLALPPDAFIA